MRRSSLGKLVVLDELRPEGVVADVLRQRRQTAAVDGVSDRQPQLRMPQPSPPQKSKQTKETRVEKNQRVRKKKAGKRGGGQVDIVYKKS